MACGKHERRAFKGGADTSWRQSSERLIAKRAVPSDTVTMDALEPFAGLHGDYARICVEMGIRPLSPEEMAALLTALDVSDVPSLH